MRYAAVCWATKRKAKKGEFGGETRDKALLKAVADTDKWEDLEYDGDLPYKIGERAAFLRHNLPLLNKMTDDANMVPALRDLMSGCFLFYDRDSGGMSGFLVRVTD